MASKNPDFSSPGSSFSAPLLLPLMLVIFLIVPAPVSPVLLPLLIVLVQRPRLQPS